VSLRTKEAIVTFEPTEVAIPQMIEAVDRLGFRASLKSSPSSTTPPTRR